MHFLLASYIADTPEVEDLLGVKQGNKPFSSVISITPEENNPIVIPSPQA